MCKRLKIVTLVTLNDAKIAKHCESSAFFADKGCRLDTVLREMYFIEFIELYKSLYN